MIVMSLSRSNHGGNIQRQAEQKAIRPTEDGTGTDDIINFIGYGPLQVATYILTGYTS